MITLSAAEQTQLAKRVARVGVRASWTYDNSAGGSYTANPTGMTTAGAFSPAYLRLEDLQFRARTPYFAEGIEFPSFNATIALPRLNETSDLFWYDYTSALDPRAIARSPMVGGPITISSEVWHSDASATLQTLWTGVVNDIRCVGYPPRLEISGVSKYESMTRRHVDYTLCQGSEAGHTNARPKIYITELLGDHNYDYCFSDWSDHPSAIQVRLFPNDMASFPDTLARLFYHGLASPRINRLDSLHAYDWCQTIGRATDATLTAASIVPDTAALVPRLDRLANGMRIRGYNIYTLTPNHYAVAGGTGSGSGNGWFGSYRSREFELDWYDIGDADCCETIIYAAFTNAFDGGGPSTPSVPTQFRCSVPFGIGVPLELGDCIAVKYEPCGMWGYSRWVLEEINFRLATMTYDLIMHDRL